MKFRYGYRTKENQKVEGCVFAHSREDVYSILKRKGIKPYFVELEAGVLNRVLYWFVKARWILVAVFVAVLCMVLFYEKRSEDSLRKIQKNLTDDVVSSRFDDMTRRQIIGDQVVIACGVRSGWSDVFVNEGDRFFASFAIPGVSPVIRSTSVEAIEKALCADVEITQDDALEVRQIKSMVQGIKNELRDFLAAGGSIKEFGDCLVERQEKEIMYRNRVKNELEMAVHRGLDSGSLEKLWEEKNIELRQMGIKHVEMPGKED